MIELQVKYVPTGDFVRDCYTREEDLKKVEELCRVLEVATNQTENSEVQAIIRVAANDLKERYKTAAAQLRTSLLNNQIERLVQLTADVDDFDKSFLAGISDRVRKLAKEIEEHEKQYFEEKFKRQKTEAAARRAQQGE